MLSHFPRTDTLRRLSLQLGQALVGWAAPTSALPDWDRLRLERSTPHPSKLELCLTEGDDLRGWASATRRSDGSLRWVERPVGPAWAREILREACREWHRTPYPNKTVSPST